MNDPDVIARVYPDVAQGHYHASNAIQNHPRHVPPQARAHHRSIRTEQADAVLDPASSSLELPYLELRFSGVPRTKHGVVFGTDPQSDVVIPNTSVDKGVSFHHFSLTFDDARRLIVKDWGSLGGTEVTYNEQGQGRRRNFKWIVSGHDIPKSKDIKISMEAKVQFLIFTVPHTIDSPSYIQKVDRFRQGFATTTDLFSDLDLPPRPDTELPTGAHTPGDFNTPIHLVKKLGEGGFGMVTHWWNVSDASECALKQPLPRVAQLGKYSRERWQTEISLMSQLDHPHIVKFLAATFDPHPRLQLEFMSGGSLEDHQDNLTSHETHVILSQCLDALTYLHEQTPPIAHRDIKPGNILVKQRSPGNICVKFGDFGLARDRSEMQSVCGSPPYQAPEIFMAGNYLAALKTQGVIYDSAVDVWSLGVTVSELVCGLPVYRDEHLKTGLQWCREIRCRLEVCAKQSDFLKFLLDNMVVLEPRARLSARKCLDRLPKHVEPQGLQTTHPHDTAKLSEENESSRNATTVAQKIAVWQGDAWISAGAGPLQPAQAMASDQGSTVKSSYINPPRTQEFQLAHEGAVSANVTRDAAELARAMRQSDTPPKSSLRRSRSPARESTQGSVQTALLVKEDGHLLYRQYRTRTPERDSDSGLGMPATTGFDHDSGGTVLRGSQRIPGTEVTIHSGGAKARSKTTRLANPAHEDKH